METQKVYVGFKNKGQTVSRGNIICAYGWNSAEIKHEIPKGRLISWVEEMTIGGRWKLNGYCSVHYQLMFKSPND